jgi:DNA-directed RNA polymerase sigma subunit (sigma70/sigma32)
MREQYKPTHAAMTFSEIAQQLGVTHAAVRQTYLNAMKKIRRDRQMMEQLRCMVQHKERQQPRETVYPEWV